MVYYYHKLIKNDNLDAVCSECKKGARGCVACKKELINKINEFLTDFREKKAHLIENPKEVEEALINGNKRAREVAKETLTEVKKAMKIDYFKE